MTGVQTCALPIYAETMQTNKHHLVKAKKAKKVVIVGGGIGGMEVARVLKLEGHEPVIYEKSDHLGGIFVEASKAQFKGKLRELIAYYLHQMEELHIEIHLNTEVKDLHDYPADEYVIATGSKPRTLKVPGIERALEACEYLDGKEVGQKVAVIGGGLTGCEIAYELFLEGKEPIIVEMLDDLVRQKGVCMANSQYLRDFFAWKKVPVYLETKLKEVRENEIVVTDKEGKDFTIPCDSVITSTGYIPTPLQTDEKHIHLVGDCEHVGNMRSVIWGAYETAMKI